MIDNEITTTDVAIRIIETTPAVVNFNFQEISDALDLALDKYNGLVFTDATIAECKKTIAELRKGQNSLEDFRKKTKAQLTESVTAFEKQCKELYSKFESVIKPLTEQQDQFETERKEKKRAEIQEIINGLVTGLSDKYAALVIIPQEYLNKGKTLKTIKTELTTLAGSLRVRQDKEEQDVNLIRTKVELANAQYQLKNPLVPGHYLRLLSYKSVSEIEDLIVVDAEGAIAKENKSTEAVALAPASDPYIIPSLGSLITSNWEGTPQVSPVVPAPIEQNIIDVVKVLNSFLEPPGLITAVYEITGTEAQLEALETYLGEQGLAWQDRPD